MNWSKVKTILIIVFFILNAFLLFLLTRYLMKSDVSNKNIENALIVLKNRGVEVKCKLVDEQFKMGTLYSKSEPKAIKIAESYLESKIKLPILMNTEYKNKDKSIVFLSTDIVLFNKLDKINTLNEKIGSDIISNIFSMANIEKPIIEQDTHIIFDDKKSAIYRQKINGYFVYDNYFKIFNSKQNETNVEFSFREIKEENAKKAVIPIYQALLKNFTGINKIEITNIDLGYKSINLNEGASEIILVPAWRIITKSNQTRFFRAYGGEEIK